MRFSIVTPSLRQLDWLRLCVRSVEDQRVEKEHIIQDAGSGPELEEWVETQTKAVLTVEQDTGIYDALNRGFSRATGDVFAWLNCDEQYLPGALSAVAARFEVDPDLDVLLADNVVVNPDGAYLAHRFSLTPNLSQMWLRFPVSSCALFFRRRVWQPFDTQWRSAGDWWWFRAMLKAGAKVDVLRQFVSVFTETGENLGLAEITRREHAAIADSRPALVRFVSPLLLTMHRLRMWRSGAFHVKPFAYEIYRPGSQARVGFDVRNPTARWRRK